MRYYLPLIADTASERVVLFTLPTNAGDVLLAFENPDNLNALIALATPVAERIGRTMGHAQIDAATREELLARVRELSARAQVMFDDDPDFEGLMSSFAASQRGEEQEPPVEQRLYDAFWDVLTAETWRNARRVIEANPELRSPASGQLVEAFCTAAVMQDPTTAPVFRQVASLLKTVHSRGLDAAFAGKRPDDDPAAAFAIEQIEPLISPGGELTDFLQTGSLAAVEKGLASFHRLLRHPQFAETDRDVRAHILQNGAELYFSRSQNGGPIDDLDRAVEFAERALAIARLASARRARCASALGIALCARYEQVVARREDLTRAIEVLQESVALTPKNDPARPTYLSNLAVALHREGRQIDRGIELLEEAAARAEPDSVDNARVLSNLCLLVTSRAAASGSRSECARAIDLGRRAVAVAKAYPQLLVTTLLNFAEALHTEYLRFSERSRLDDSIATLERARSLAAGFSRAVVLSRLGPRYRHRFGWTSKREDLENAVETLEEAVGLTPRKASRRWEMISDLVQALLQLSQHIGGIVPAAGVELRYESVSAPTAAENRRCAALLQRAIDLAEEAVRTADPTSLPDALDLVFYARSVRMSSHSGQGEDSGRAFEALQSALELTPHGSLDWSRRLVQIAPLFDKASPELQAEIEGAQERLIRDGLDTNADQAHRRALVWAWPKFAKKQWAEAQRPFELLLEARRRLIEVQLARESKETWIAVLQEDTHRAAYVFAKNGDLRRAALALEGGRAHVLTAAFLRDRADLSALAAAHPSLHRRYMEAADCLASFDREELRGHNSLAPEVVAEARAAREAFETVLDEIRRVPGLDHFLAPVTFADIERAVSGSNASALVYLTATEAGSLALVVTARGVDAVWIDVDIDAVNEFLAAKPWSVLPQLAVRLMKPVAAHLRTIRAERVVLIPSGQLGALPLHACVVDEFAVSFAPNARVLADVRRTAAADEAHFLGIGNPLPHPRPLRGAELEVAAIAKLFPQATTLFGVAATAQAIVLHMRAATHIHFACHGAFDAESPLDSRLELGGGERLRLRDFLESARTLENTRCVTLSACESAVTESRRLHDEFIGLPAAFLQAGVSGVAGSLWLVDDLATALLMIRFYQDRARDEYPAAALCAAQRWLRDLTRTELQQVLREQGVDSSRAPDNERPYAAPYFWAAFAFFGT